VRGGCGCEGRVREERDVGVKGEVWEERDVGVKKGEV